MLSVIGILELVVFRSWVIVFVRVCVSVSLRSGSLPARGVWTQQASVAPSPHRPVLQQQLPGHRLSSAAYPRDQRQQNSHREVQLPAWVPLHRWESFFYRTFWSLSECFRHPVGVVTCEIGIPRFLLLQAPILPTSNHRAAWYIYSRQFMKLRNRAKLFLCLKRAGVSKLHCILTWSSLLGCTMLRGCRSI